MIKSYIKIAVRNLKRNITISLINICGLALGIATCLLISLYITDELSYARFNNHADRIVRVVFKGKVKGGDLKEAHVMPPVASTMKAELSSDIEETARLRIGGAPLFMVGDQVFHDEHLAYVDAAFFRIFTLPLLKGDHLTALTQPNTAIISETMARKYFNTIDVIGKELPIKENESILKITGVMQDIPKNSHFNFDIFTSIEALEDAKSTSWMTSEYYTYALLKKDAAIRQVETKLATLFDKHVGPQFMAGFGMSYEEYKKTGNKIGLYLQPLTDIHLHSDFVYDLSPSGNIKYLYIFGVIGLFMLLIATINFMNLSTANGSRRFKEVGVRKVLGAGKQKLLIQFFTEGILITYIALLLAVCIVVVALPLFNHFSGKSLGITQLSPFTTIPFLIGFGLLIGLFSSSYPALYLSSYNPLSILRNRLNLSEKGLSLRSGLVVFQFMISVGLIFCTVVVSRQLDYMRHIKLGYDKENVIIVQSWPLGANEKAFAERLAQDSRIMHISHSSYLPAGDSYNNNFFIYPKENPNQWVKTLRYDVDEQYIPAMGMKIKEGRNFSKAYGNDSLSVVINETAAKNLGWTDNIIGRTLTNKDNKVLQVIGVVEDFHFKPLHETIAPLVMVLSDQAGNLIIKTKATNMEKLLATVKKHYQAFPSDLPFDYSFLDERYNQTYQSELKTGQLLTIFAALTIFVACLGLLGLAIFTTNQRKKEIGIRKVIGASVPDIARMLSFEFIRLVVISIIIASPIAWWMMNLWLQDFAYRIDIKWWMFAIAGILAIVIALLTVSSQAIRAALVNPVHSLKDE